MDKKFAAYKIIRFIARIVLGLLMPFKVQGKENIPDGAAVICANHSSWMDPVYMAFAVPSKHHLCLMAKKELFSNKIAAWLFNAIGTFPVDRAAADMNAMKNAMVCLKNGKKLGIFPEGTRVEHDGDASPKAGAVRIAEKCGAPIVPMYLSRRKKMFRRTLIVIGEPIVYERSKVRKTHEEYEELANELMHTISKLGENDMQSIEA